MLTATDCSASLRTDASLADAPSRVTEAAIAEVAVYRDPREVDAIWAELEAAAAVSPYQTRSFLCPWIATLGAMRGIEPVFIVGKDRQGRAVALLPLGLERHGPLRVARFLGGKDSNFNLGLFRPNVTITERDLRILFRAAAKAMGADRPHCFILQNQPFAWQDIANPLALLPHQASPSYAYATKLAGKGETFVAGKLSKDTRKKLRKKEARLAELGPLTAITNDTPANATAILDAFLSAKIARSEAQAYDADFATPAMRDFLEILSVPHNDQPAFVEFHALQLGERIVATYAGAAHRNHFSCFVNSFDADPEIAKSSPGDLLLMRLVAAQCDKGRTGFDLGIGEARYKASYCDRILAGIAITVMG